MPNLRGPCVIDPPSGWRYGFPAVLPEGMSMEELLRKKKYPEDQIEFALAHMRWWYLEDDTSYE